MVKNTGNTVFTTNSTGDMESTTVYTGENISLGRDLVTVKLSTI